ncbi:hypothetical protein [Pseudonocardia acaciae]|uniref:hypothetical protein n=1 Tax=Pseudonocardia acaciae TaxID=551276 RepID=UPI000A51C112|nr:hypothetical protein [Pseudonocardia acaciae]
MTEHAGAPPEEPDAEDRPAEHVGSHEAPDGAPLDPLIDLSRDPTPGKPNHARPDDE